MRKKFLPVYFLKMAQKLKQGTPRKKIAAEMAQKHGIPKETGNTYLSRVFPKKQAVSPADIERLLWKKRRTIRSSFDRKEAALKSAATLTPKQRRDRAKRGLEAIAALTPKQRRPV